MELLEGVRVLDVSRFATGPHSTWLLACLGAEVIRVEDPLGSMDRTVGLTTQTGDNLFFLTNVAGKKCITLDFAKGDRAKQLFARLVEKSDVVVENFGPGVPEALCLTYEELCKIKPDIIVVSIKCFGPTGPYKDRVGFDGTIQPMAGVMSVTGLPELPIRTMFPWTDYTTASHCALGIISALFHRYKTGEGQKIELSMLRSAVTWSSALINEYSATKKRREPQRGGNRTSLGIISDLFETKDGKWIYISVPHVLFRRFLRAMGREDLAGDPRFKDDVIAYENRHILDPIVKEWTASKTMEELEELALRFKIPMGPYLDYTEVADHPQVKAEKILIQATLSDGSFTLPVPGCPIRFSKDIMKDNTTIPMLGEHNQEIWGELCGLNTEDLAELKEEGVI